MKIITRIRTETGDMNWRKLFGKIFVGVYFAPIIILVILAPFSGGWSLFPIMFLTEPLVIIICRGIPWIIKPYYDFISNIPDSLVMIFGAAINLVMFYGVGYVIGFVIEKIFKFVNRKYPPIP